MAAEEAARIAVERSSRGSFDPDAFESARVNNYAKTRAKRGTVVRQIFSRRDLLQGKALGATNETQLRKMNSSSSIYMDSTSSGSGDSSDDGSRRSDDSLFASSSDDDEDETTNGVGARNRKPFADQQRFPPPPPRGTPPSSTAATSWTRKFGGGGAAGGEADDEAECEDRMSQFTMRESDLSCASVMTDVLSASEQMREKVRKRRDRRGTLTPAKRASTTPPGGVLASHSLIDTAMQNAKYRPLRRQDSGQFSKGFESKRRDSYGRVSSGVGKWKRARAKLFALGAFMKSGVERHDWDDDELDKDVMISSPSMKRPPRPLARTCSSATCITTDPTAASPADTAKRSARAKSIAQRRSSHRSDRGDEVAKPPATTPPTPGLEAKMRRVSQARMRRKSQLLLTLAHAPSNDTTPPQEQQVSPSPPLASSSLRCDQRADGETDRWRRRHDDAALVIQCRVRSQQATRLALQLLLQQQDATSLEQQMGAPVESLPSDPEDDGCGEAPRETLHVSSSTTHPLWRQDDPPALTPAPPPAATNLTQSGGLKTRQPMSSDNGDEAPLPVASKASSSSDSLEPNGGDGNDKPHQRGHDAGGRKSATSVKRRTVGPRSHIGGGDVVTFREVFDICQWHDADGDGYLTLQQCYESLATLGLDAQRGCMAIDFAVETAHALKNRGRVPAFAFAHVAKEQQHDDEHHCEGMSRMLAIFGAHFGAEIRGDDATLGSMNLATSEDACDAVDAANKMVSFTDGNSDMALYMVAEAKRQAHDRGLDAALPKERRRGKPPAAASGQKPQQRAEVQLTNMEALEFLLSSPDTNNEFLLPDEVRVLREELHSCGIDTHGAMDPFEVIDVLMAGEMSPS